MTKTKKKKAKSKIKVIWDEPIEEEPVLVDVGMTVGKIMSMDMGTRFTNICIVEEMNGTTIQQQIIVKNELAETLRMGQSLCVKLEVFK